MGTASILATLSHSTGSEPGRNLIHSARSSSTCRSTLVPPISQIPCADKPPWVQRLGGPALREFVWKRDNRNLLFFSPAPQKDGAGWEGEVL